MRAVIPAAGMGKRMGSLTSHSHKALLEIDGQTLLQRAIASMKAAGIGDIYVITGHQADRIQEHVGDSATCLFNPFYKVAGVLASFWHAMPFVDGHPFLFTFADHFFNPALLKQCCKQPADLFTFIQNKKEYTAEDSKVLIDDGKMVRFGKDIPLEATGGEYTGLTAFSASGSTAFFEAVRHLLATGSLNAYAMDALNMLLNRDDVRCSWAPCDEKSRIEIDSVADLRRARRIAHKVVKTTTIRAA